MINFFRFTRSNTFIKVLSFVVAFSLWLYVMSEQNPSISRVYTVNVQLTNAPASLIILDSQLSVRVKVSAARSVLSDVSSRDIKASIDLTGLEKGSHDKQVVVTIPAGVQLDEVSPQNITIVADNRISRSFPINVRFDGSLPEELSVRTVAIEPNIASVQGAESEIDKIYQIEAFCSFDRNMNQKGRHTTNIALVAKDSNGNVVGNVNLQPANTDLTIEITDNIVTKEVPVKLAYIGTLAPGYRMASTSVIPESVVLTGPLAQLQEISEITVQEININNFNNTYSAAVPLNLPESVTANVENVDVVLTITGE